MVNLDSFSMQWIGAMAYVLGKPNEYVQWRSDSYFITGITAKKMI